MNLQNIYNESLISSYTLSLAQNTTGRYLITIILIISLIPALKSRVALGGLALLLKLGVDDTATTVEFVVVVVVPPDKVAVLFDPTAIILSAAFSAATMIMACVFPVGRSG